MKAYSDTLSLDDLRDCLPPGIGMDATPMNRPRTRRHGWTIRLNDWSRRQHKNSGTHGAATWDSPAASYDSHGEWMAKVYDLDPDAVIAVYKSRDDFHRQTRGDYLPKVNA